MARLMEVPSGMVSGKSNKLVEKKSLACANSLAVIITSPGPSLKKCKYAGSCQAPIGCSPISRLEGLISNLASD